MKINLIQKVLKIHVKRETLKKTNHWKKEANQEMIRTGLMILNGLKKLLKSKMLVIKRAKKMIGLSVNSKKMKPRKSNNQIIKFQMMKMRSQKKIRLEILGLLKRFRFNKKSKKNQPKVLKKISNFKKNRLNSTNKIYWQDF